MKISDEDLLFAAKAAGVTPGTLTINGVTTYTWKPWEDDGEALRLAVKLGLSVQSNNPVGITCILWNGEERLRSVTEDHDGDLLAATRRAIFRAAVAIGRAMP